ncbi:hypothetical protein GCM10009665_01450 [Kitasatospora nipponensis]|uniref:Flagellin-like protein n=1 Tax=Kitasatospora nipponensis TaxID=258049 RepID=A0ABP4G6F0_9ACTN
MRTTFSYADAFARTLGRRVATRLAGARARAKAAPDGGYTTETIVITALLILLAIGALGILATKVTDKANSLNF